jgi:hypothetical protein
MVARILLAPHIAVDAHDFQSLCQSGAYQQVIKAKPGYAIS